jgi:hypothetical protein
MLFHAGIGMPLKLMVAPLPAHNLGQVHAVNQSLQGGGKPLEAVALDLPGRQLHRMDRHISVQAEFRHCPLNMLLRETQLLEKAHQALFPFHGRGKGPTPLLRG